MTTQHGRPCRNQGRPPRIVPRHPDERITMTTDQTPETDEQRADREETELAHASGNHGYCGITCEVTLPTEMLRNGILAKGYPGTAGMLDELLRRAAVAVPPPADQTALPAARLLDCGWCYEEHGEEVHPHPECPIGQVVAPADQTALRERIADALYERERPPRDPAWAEAFAMDREVFEAMADAVLAVLPEQADRAAECSECDDTGACNGGPCPLRRVAAEEQPAETCASEAHPPTHTWTVESPRRDNWASWGTTYDDRDWALESYEHSTKNAPARPFRLVRATSTYTVEAEHTPPTARPAVGEQPETQETPRG